MSGTWRPSRYWAVFAAALAAMTMVAVFAGVWTGDERWNATGLCLLILMLGATACWWMASDAEENP